MDLVFVVDASTSIKPNNFRHVKNFLADVVGELDISQSLVRVAVVRFSDDVQILLYLNQSTSRQHVQKLILNMFYQQGECFTTLHDNQQIAIKVAARALVLEYSEQILTIDGYQL